ncbi:MAG: Na(+)-translocating NADH-quinone reductase subunit F [Phycisphaerae bacterium]|nr:Na(+)-translocating NADH-quinone reductase subunit F [Phycisphaerae bacterium]
MSELPIRFEPSGRTAHVLPGSAVLEAAALAGLPIQTPCGGEGTCGKCRVRFLTDPPPPLDADRRQFTAAQLDEGWRLGCRHELAAPVRLLVPAESVYGTTQQILTSDQRVNIDVAPALRRRFVKLAPPTLEDDRDDLARLRAGLGTPGLHVPVELLRTLPTLLRDSGWEVTVTTLDDGVLNVSPGRDPASPLGVAFDIGTTTVVATLMDLRDGRELAVAARLNPQVQYADDVVSRIRICIEQPGGLDRLHGAIVRGCAEMIAETAAKARVAAADIGEVVVAGNTTMQLIFAGVHPGPLGVIPFAPGFAQGLSIEAAVLPLGIHPRGGVYLLPAIRGFLGGDTVAGLLATGLAELPGPTLLIDIGTNGEIVLAKAGRMWAASTAAGPAFEGARISQGMRAAVGAIEKVVIDGDVRINVLGDAPPVGLCGTALIDAVAGLLRAGLVETTGRLQLPESLAGTPLAARLRGEGTQLRFVLAEGPDGEAVALTQRDIRELQLASGAIRAGIAILLERAGVSAGDLESVFLAGAFGNYVRRENALRIGLLPDVPIERIHFVGNAASMGAKLALLSQPARERAETLARATEHVDLSADMGFQMKFADAMIFP